MNRHLPPILKEDFDALGLPDTLLPAELFVQVALSCEGVTEFGGDNKGPIVELFQGSISMAMQQSWCLDFVQACVAYVEAARGIQSNLPASELCLQLWNESPHVDYPKRGDLIVWQMGNTHKGHVGIIVEDGGLTWNTIEGNTGPGGEIERNGDGVYRKKRKKGGSVTFREKGFIRVFG